MIRYRYLRKREELRVYRLVQVVIGDKLASKEAIDYALSLGPESLGERAAIEDCLDAAYSAGMNEPWLSVWQLIQTQWLIPADYGGGSVAGLRIAERLLREDRSQGVLREIVDLARPVVRVSSIREEGKPTKIRGIQRAQDLARFEPHSCKVSSIAPLKLDLVRTDWFLEALIGQLLSALREFIGWSSRLGIGSGVHAWELGGLYRARDEVGASAAENGEDPDRYHQGVAPSVKLLSRAIRQLSLVSLPKAKRVVGGLLGYSTPILERLWSGLALDPLLVLEAEVAKYLCSSRDEVFWNCYDYPELAELRASRFGSLDDISRLQILGRLQEGPPLTLFRRGLSVGERLERRQWCVESELARIAGAGDDRHSEARLALSELQSSTPEDELMGRAMDYGFPRQYEAEWVAPLGDADFLVPGGMQGLRTLEAELDGTASHPGKLDAWLQAEGNTARVVDILRTVPAGKLRFPHVISRIGNLDRPDRYEPIQRTAAADAMLRIISKLSATVLESSVDGLCAWLHSWRVEASRDPRCQLVWMRLWPFANRSTNGKYADNELLTPGADLLEGSGSSRVESDSLNTSVGKLLGVFVELCRASSEVDSASIAVGHIKSALVEARGYSGHLAKFRLMGLLSFLYHLDQEWTETHLIAPLMGDSVGQDSYWLAVSRQVTSRDVLALISGPMMRFVTRPTGDREVRESLARGLLVESLRAFFWERDAKVSIADLQQTVRSMTPELRAASAEVPWRFMKEVAASSMENVVSARRPDHCLDVIKRFFECVWPREGSFVTVGVASALAKLPSTLVARFREVVAVVDRFLVPFDCWSIHDFELDSSLMAEVVEGGGGESLLWLLDRCIGSSEDAVVPMDLALSLDLIVEGDEALRLDSRYQRLLLLSRRR